MERSSEKSIVINNLLSFLVWKFKLVPKDKLLNCISNYYSNKDILESRKSLLASLPIKKSTRLGRKVKHPDVLVAIYECIQLIPEDDMPTFVCENLNNIPTINMEKTDSGDCFDLPRSENFIFIKDQKGKLDKKTFSTKKVEMIQDSENISAAVQCRKEQKQMKVQISEMMSIIIDLKDGLQRLTQGSKPFKKENSTTFIEKNDCNNLNSETKLTERPKEVKKEWVEDDDLDDISSEEMDSELSGFALIQKLIDEDAEDNEMSPMEEEDAAENFFDCENDFIELTSFRKPGKKTDFIPTIAKKTSIRRKKSSSVGTAPKRNLSYKSVRDVSNTSSQRTIEISESEKEVKKIVASSEIRGRSIQTKFESQFDDVQGTKPDLRACAPEKCPICDINFVSKQHYDIHARMHYTKGTYDCTLCDQTFGTRESLVLHFVPCFEEVKEHCNLDENTCSTCGSFYADQKALSKHMAYHSECRLCPCPHCSYRFFSKSALQLHIRNQHNPMNKFQCTLCNLTFPCNSYLTIHIACHTGIKPFSCNICNYKADSKKGIKRHILTHGGNQLKKYKCKECDYTCNGRYIMVKHRQKEHVEAYTCTLCNKSFQNPSAYRRHYDIHLAKRSFKCDFCNYSTPFGRYLKKHMLTHPLSSDIVCPQCGIFLSSTHTAGHHVKKYCKAGKAYSSTKTVN